jgi:DNA-binding PadR family transcriptional regulator
MKQQSIGEFEELALLKVAGLDNQACGVVNLENLEQKLEEKVNFSAIHVALKHMEIKGFLESRFSGLTSVRGGRSKKLYSITAFGKRTLDQQYEIRTELYQQIPKISFS